MCVHTACEGSQAFRYFNAWLFEGESKACMALRGGGGSNMSGAQLRTSIMVELFKNIKFDEM
jgi:hypothetical protein